MCVCDKNACVCVRVCVCVLGGGGECVFERERERVREKEGGRKDLITSTNVKFLQIPAAFSYTANGIISNTSAIYQVKSLQELTALSNFMKSIIANPLAV